MGIHHLISVDEDQLRNWQGDKDELISSLGSAIVLVCMDTEAPTVSISASGEPEGASVITVKHVAKHEHEDVELWAWSSGDAVAIADLAPGDLDLLERMIGLQRQLIAGQGVSIALN